MELQVKDCLGYRLRRISRIIDGHLKVMLSNYDITENQMTILFTLNETGKIDQGKIGAILLLEGSTVSRNIKLLDKVNLIEKSTDYRPKVALSEKGKKLVDELMPLWNKTMSTLFETIGKEGIKQIGEIEKKLL